MCSQPAVFGVFGFGVVGSCGVVVLWCFFCPLEVCKDLQRITEAFETQDPAAWAAGTLLFGPGGGEASHQPIYS